MRSEHRKSGPDPPVDRTTGRMQIYQALPPPPQAECHHHRPGLPDGTELSPITAEIQSMPVARRRGCGTGHNITLAPPRLATGVTFAGSLELPGNKATATPALAGGGSATPTSSFNQRSDAQATWVRPVAWAIISRRHSAVPQPAKRDRLFRSEIKPPRYHLTSGTTYRRCFSPIESARCDANRR